MKTRIRASRSAVCSLRSPVCSLQPAVCGLRSIRGFTLLELLVVIALMLVLAGLLIPAFYKVQNEARKRRATTEAAVIATAIQAYRARERMFPAPTGDLDGNADVTYDGQGGNPDNRRVMEKLTNAVPPVIDAEKLRWDGAGNVLNPWGGQYKIQLDLDYDGWLDLNGNGEREQNENLEFYVE